MSMSSGWFSFELIPVFAAIAQILEFGNTKCPCMTLKKFLKLKKHQHGISIHYTDHWKAHCSRQMTQIKKEKCQASSGKKTLQEDIFNIT